MAQGSESNNQKNIQNPFGTIILSNLQAKVLEINPPNPFATTKSNLQAKDQEMLPSKPFATTKSNLQAKD